ncbi:helix-turn-helix domain-containing protein [Paenibacillus konkukensis]|uniref:helix-turn-helix domain-containing protein n=1 Tax=Paenibacillus konkukensis TaxID=2020716 RepID=UPI00201DC49F|nr:AraC family transcriptional regulator [Paenibacillus konkukensis]
MIIKFINGLADARAAAPYSKEGMTSLVKPFSENDEFLKGTLFEIDEVGKSPQTPSWFDASSPLKHHAVIYIVQGEGQIRVNGRTEAISKDSLYVYAPGSTLELKLASQAEMYWAAYDIYRSAESGDQVRSFERERTFPVQGHVKASGSRFKRLLFLLVSEGGRAKGESRFLAQHYLQELLDGILHTAAPAAVNDLEDRLRLTASYMQRHYREDIRIDTLAEMAQLHPSYYSQVFKQEMGKTPIAYLTQLRMNKAKEMLLLTDKPVREVAGSVGYADEFYFSRRFKETSGSAPSLYIKKDHASIVSLSAPYTDHLVTLGLTPCAAQVHRHIPVETRALNLPKHASEPWEASREAFLLVKPDLIITKDNVLPKAREHINDIAPIIGIDWTSKDVFTHMRDIAGLVNRHEAARRWLEHHELRTEGLRRKARMSLGDAVVTICVGREHKLRIYGSRNIGHVFYRSLQLKPPERTAQSMKPYLPGTGYNWTAIIPDELLQYESDYLFLVIETESDRKRMLHWLRSNPSWIKHPAVRSKRVYFLDWDKWMVYAPYGIDRQLDEIEQFIGYRSMQAEYF